MVVSGRVCKNYVLNTVLHTRLKLYTRVNKLYTRADFTHASKIHKVICPCVYNYTHASEIIHTRVYNFTHVRLK